MRRLHRISPLVLCLALLSAGCSDDDHDVGTGTQLVLGSGVVVEEDRPVSGFSAVTFATEGSLNIERGAQEALRVRAEDNLLPYLKSEVQAGMLVLRTKSGVDIAPTRPIEFDVTVIDLSSLVFSGVGDVDCANVDGGDFTVVLSGVGDILVEGTVDAQVVTASGIGTYDAANLASREARLTLNSLSAATVRVSDLLVVSFTNGGSVDYIGDPELQVTGSGSVRKIG